MIGKPFWFRLLEAQEYLDARYPTKCIAWEDPAEPDTPVRITYPDGNWLAAAMEGGIIPPVEAYSKVRIGWWQRPETALPKAYARWQYALGNIEQARDKAIKANDLAGLAAILPALLAEAHAAQEKALASAPPDLEITGYGYGEAARLHQEKHGGIYRIIDYTAIHNNVAPAMSEDEAIEYLIKQAIPPRVWRDYKGNRQILKRIRVCDVPTDRSDRDNWTVEMFVEKITA